jgi:predicted phage terminase large subunit-like protein
MAKEVLNEVRKLAEADFISFVKLVAPYNVMGMCHEELCKFLTNPDYKPYRLVLYPRGHRKSFYAAMYACWRIIVDPSVSIVYLSATSDLAESQLRTIKGTLDSPIVRRYWPELINADEGKREKWTSTEICVDDPRRKAEGTRDSTVKAGGLTTNITGAHCDLIILDDMVVPKNNTEEGRRQVMSQYSQLQSILNPGGAILAVGTRYHPKDIYSTMQETVEEIYNEAGELIGKEPQWDILQKSVEENGEFLWNRQKRKDGKFYGFDFKELARIKAGYVDKSQFYAQYYNDPNDEGSALITQDMFEYYNRDHLRTVGGVYHIKDRPLNVYAAIDFAFSIANRADSTAIVVVGVDPDNNKYVLDIDRFKTDRIQEYYNHVIAIHEKYNLKKLRAEVTVAQQVIVTALKDKLAENSTRLVIEDYRPQTKKEERVLAVLRPLYEDHKVFHYRGGNCEILEEELKQLKPAHDDVKNALADAISISVAPKQRTFQKFKEVKTLSRFGGI